MIHARRRTKAIFALLFTLHALLLTNTIQAQKIEVLTSGNKISLRGLSVVTDDIVWVSGHRGTVGKSLDGGNTWQWLKVKGFDSTDFRDIEAFSSTEAVIMAVDSPAYILKTIDGGASWKVVYENHGSGMFLDAMEFWNEQSGIVIGDPIKGRFFFARTFDGGNTWTDLPFEKRPEAVAGEACFAASGTNIRAFKKDEAIFVSGGKQSQVFIRHQHILLPVIQGGDLSGANSIAVGPKQKALIVVSGDYSKPAQTTQTCAVSFNKGKSWQLSATPPNGYRSCVEFTGKKTAVTCGLNGVDYSTDNGLNWRGISTEGFHVCRKAKNGEAVFFAGGNGKVGRLVL